MKFTFKSIDKEGSEILDAMASAPAFNRWMYRTIEPYCQGKILEIGSGVGNISRFFLADKKQVTLSDVRENYRQVLKNNFSLNDDRVLAIDIVHPEFQKKHPELYNGFDSIFALNVVEHIEDDNAAVKNMLDLLKPGGRLTILVPAYQGLYNEIDHSLEHFRRYNKKTLSALMSKYGKVEETFYFNASGIPAWWLSGKVLGQKTIPESEMKLYNAFVPLFKLIDKVTMNRFGLSVICVIRKAF